MYVTFSSVSSATGKAKISPENRSPIICNSTDDNEDIEEDHDGAHDTITSLAGAKMLQRYRRAMSGSHKGSSSSISQVNGFSTVENLNRSFRFCI